MQCHVLIFQRKTVHYSWFKAIKTQSGHNKRQNTITSNQRGNQQTQGGKVL